MKKYDEDIDNELNIEDLDTDDIDNYEDDPDSQEKDSSGHSQVTEPPRQHVLRKLRGVADQKQVNKRGNSDIMPVKKEVNNQQHRIDQHI